MSLSAAERFWSGTGSSQGDIYNRTKTKAWLCRCCETPCPSSLCVFFEYLCVSVYIKERNGGVELSVSSSAGNSTHFSPSSSSS